MKLIELGTATGGQARQIADLHAREYGLRARDFSAWDASAAVPVSGRFVLCDEQTDGVISYGAVWHTGNDKFRMDLIVDAGHRRQGLGAAMLEHLTRHAVALGARTMQARAERGAIDALSFLEHRGFRETMRMHRFELNVSQAQSSIGASDDHLRDRGITIRTLAEQAQSPAVYAAIAEVYEAAGDEWPDPDPGGTRPPLTGAAVRDMFERWHVTPEAVFLALSGSQTVGFCGIGAQGKSIGTAVRPEFRGRGIATALKVKLIRWAAANRVSRLRSATAHPAMIQLNRNLGFEETSVEVRLVRRFS